MRVLACQPNTRSLHLKLSADPKTCNDCLRCHMQHCYLEMRFVF